MLTPQEQQYVKEYLAEENIVAYLLKNPESIHEVMQKITPEYFVTDFHRYAYSAIYQKASQNPDFQLSFDTLREIFDYDEKKASQILGIFSHYEEISITEQALQECISSLYEYKNSLNKNDIQTDDDLRNFANKKKQSMT